MLQLGCRDDVPDQAEAGESCGHIAGRENNRRVEFVVHFIILNDGSK